MKYMMVSCKEATFLMSKKAEATLSMVEKLKLWFHTSMCTFCKRFEKQTEQMAEECKQLRSLNELPALAKERIEKSLKNQPL